MDSVNLTGYQKKIQQSARNYASCNNWGHNSNVSCVWNHYSQLGCSNCCK